MSYISFNTFLPGLESYSRDGFIKKNGLSEALNHLRGNAVDRALDAFTIKGWKRSLPPLSVSRLRHRSIRRKNAMAVKHLPSGSVRSCAAHSSSGGRRRGLSSWEPDVLPNSQESCLRRHPEEPSPPDPLQQLSGGFVGKPEAVGAKPARP